jgi:hypothetical protein
LACPFFFPSDRADDLVFPHPARLPLGAAWRGTCQAGLDSQSAPDNLQLESCNLGYAKSCPRLPRERAGDAVRFAVVNDSGTRVSMQFVLEREYLPASNGLLEYDPPAKTWIACHPEPRIQKMAECFLQSYLARKIPL